MHDKAAQPQTAELISKTASRVACQPSEGECRALGLSKVATHASCAWFHSREFTANYAVSRTPVGSGRSETTPEHLCSCCKDKDEKKRRMMKLGTVCAAMLGVCRPTHPLLRENDRLDMAVEGPIFFCGPTLLC